MPQMFPVYLVVYYFFFIIILFVSYYKFYWYLSNSDESNESLTDLSQLYVSTDEKLNFKKK
uniref:ATP synthase subunit 8 n=1 Tax=Plegadiphilus threskiornis TaxID=2965265 RepID=A0A9Y1YSC7_9NEOP|nr:ATP synthase F0 subunit 8 [Plegadiphilus threskiornis]WIM51525.1 ATP synthase subunit 8 [Plegadiphilus threskiornis]